MWNVLRAVPSAQQVLADICCLSPGIAPKCSCLLADSVCPQGEEGSSWKRTGHSKCSVNIFWVKKPVTGVQGAKISGNVPQ